MLRMADYMAAGLAGFIAGKASHLNAYPADGTIFDYMAGARRIPVSFAIEMWGIGDNPTLQCFDLFNPRSENLRASLEDLLPLYRRFFQALLDQYAPARGLSIPGKDRVRIASPLQESKPAATLVQGSAGDGSSSSARVSKETSTLMSELESSKLSFAARLRFTVILAVSSVLSATLYMHRRRLRIYLCRCKRNPHIIALSRLGEDVGGYA